MRLRKVKHLCNSFCLLLQWWTRAYTFHKYRRKRKPSTCSHQWFWALVLLFILALKWHPVESHILQLKIVTFKIGKELLLSKSPPQTRSRWNLNGCLPSLHSPLSDRGCAHTPPVYLPEHPKGHVTSSGTTAELGRMLMLSRQTGLAPWHLEYCHKLTG